MASNNEIQAFSSEHNVIMTSFNNMCATTSNSDNQCNVVDSSNGRKWQFRPPPRGLTLNEYVLCHK